MNVKGLNKESISRIQPNSAMSEVASCLHNFDRKTKLFLIIIAWFKRLNTRQIQLHGILCMLNEVSDRERVGSNLSICNEHH